MTQSDQAIPAMPGVVNAASVGEKRPGINRMGVGRTVAIRPIRKETVQKVKNNVPVAVRRIIADVIVLDGQAITYGGNIPRSEPDTKAQPVPCVIRELWIDEAALGNQLEPWVGTGNYVVGHLIKLPPQGDNHPAWAITQQPTDEENALFARFWQLAQGRPDLFQNPQPYALNAAPLPAQPAPQTQQQAAPAASPGVDVAALIAAAQAASQAPTGAPAGSGISDEAWAALPAEQRQAIAAHYAPKPTGF